MQVIRPQNPRQHSEISTGSHALTAQARSERDRLERKHVDHWTRIEAPRAFPPHARSSVPTAVPRGKKEPSLRQKGAKWSVGARSFTCVGAGEARSPKCVLAQRPLVPAQPPGPGVPAPESEGW